MRFLADENFSNRILRGLRREQAEIDVVRVQDIEIYGADDPTVLAWAATEERILLTHDVNTVPNHAYERVRKGQPMPGVIAVHLEAPIGTVLDDLLLIVGASELEEYDGQVVFLPL